MTRRRAPLLKCKPLPPAERLRELLDYDPETGVLTWRVRRRGRAKAGRVAGTLKKRGSLEVKVDGVRYQVHRLVWKIQKGKDPAALLDHWNRRPGDNRFSNLREADRHENVRNANLNRPSRSVNFASMISSRTYLRRQEAGRPWHLSA